MFSSRQHLTPGPAFASLFAGDVRPAQVLVIPDLCHRKEQNDPHNDAGHQYAAVASVARMERERNPGVDLMPQGYSPDAGGKGDATLYTLQYRVQERIRVASPFPRRETIRKGK